MSTLEDFLMRREEDDLPLFGLPPLLETEQERRARLTLRWQRADRLREALCPLQPRSFRRRPERRSSSRDRARLLNFVDAPKQFPHEVDSRMCATCGAHDARPDEHLHPHEARDHWNVGDTQNKPLTRGRNTVRKGLENFSYYNTEWRHSALGNIAPAESERR